MKKMIAALAITALAFGGAQAQTAKFCGVKKDKVCRITGDKKVSCYKTKYAENFKVCMNDNGYYICCETPNKYNSTNYSYMLVKKTPARNYDQEYAVNTQTQEQPDPTVPQSQSYVVTNTKSYEGYYPRRGRIKVCYVGENVAQQNRNPYEGCPSPQSEGPEVNRQRNVNVSNPEPMPPLAGGSMY